MGPWYKMEHPGIIPFQGVLCSDGQPIPQCAMCVTIPFPFRAVAAVRPASLTLVSPISVATIADAMRSMDVLTFLRFHVT